VKLFQLFIHSCWFSDFLFFAFCGVQKKEKEKRKSERDLTKMRKIKETRKRLREKERGSEIY
jgi:hypothetical protein